MKILWKSYENPMKILWKSYENPMKILWKSYENNDIIAKKKIYTEHRGLRILVWWSVLGAPGTSWGRCGPGVDRHWVKPIGQADTCRNSAVDSEWLSWLQSVLNLSINWSCRGVSQVIPYPMGNFCRGLLPTGECHHWQVFFPLKEVFPAVSPLSPMSGWSSYHFVRELGHIRVKKS